MKIIITGGHLTPALACIDFIQKNHPNDEIIFIGRKFSQENGKLAQEENEIKRRNIKFLPLSSPKFQSHKTFNLLIQMPKLTKAIIKSKQIINWEKPEVFLSFGGYLSIPVSLAAKLTNTKIIIHEQTSELGLANKIASLFANKIALSQENSKYLNNKKFILTGNPIRESLVKKTSAPNWIENFNKKPILYITGGNQGSEIINKLVKQSLEKLLENFIIIHQLGNSYKTTSKKDYYARSWIEEKELAWILQNADLALSRSGANSVQELQYFAIPTLFIPLPTARNNEQLHNAQKIEKLGGALILEQEQANSNALIKNLKYLLANRETMREKLQENQPKQSLNAAENIYELLKSI